MANEKDPRRWDEVIIDSPFAKLTKRDVHEYYRTPKVQQAILDAVGSREAIVRQSFAPDKTVLRRKDERGSLIRLDPESLDKWNERRLSEVHPTFGRKTDVLLADIDPQEGVDWRRTKKITETVAKTMQSHPAVRDVSVRYSGGRGFYVEGKLDEPIGVDRARNLTKSILDGLAQRHDVFFEPVGPGHIRLDTTPLKYRGSVRSPYSIHSETGLVSAPVKIEDLPSVQKKDFTVQKVLERMREKKAAASLPQSLLDEVSKDKWATRAYGQKTLKEIKEGKRDVIPIQDEGKTVGFMSPNKTVLGYPSTGFVFVSPSSRGKGLAAKVLKEYAKKNPKAISFIHRDNIASQKAHEHAGWEDSGEAARGNPRAHVWKVKHGSAAPSFSIRAMTTEDVARYNIPELQEDAGKALADENLIAFGPKGDFAGFVTRGVKNNSLKNLWVHPDFRRQGLAKRFLTEALSSTPTSLDVRAENEAAKTLYKQLGYTKQHEWRNRAQPAEHWVKKAMEIKQAFEIPFQQIAMVLDDTPMYYRQYLAHQKAHQQRALAAAQQQAQPQLNAKLSAATEFAPGIPMNRKVHKIPTSTTPQTWTLAIQKHDADRAGTHFDFRLVPPQGGKAHSWAIPKARLPEQGKMLLAIQQPTHTAQYAENFTGTIPKGTYGSGKVDMHLKEPVKILSSGDNKIKFERDNGEKYTLFRTRDKHWGITKNATQVIEDWKKKKKEEKVTAFIRERMRGN